MTGRRHEQGAALISVLILVAVLGALAVAVFDRLRLATLLTANSAGADEARSYAGIAEALVATRIEDLLGQSPRTTNAGDWQDRGTILPLPRGSAAIRVRDGGNCFNLNSLVAGGDGSLASRPFAIDQFARLLILEGVGDRQARRLAAATADWIDSDGDANPDGAEDASYAGGATPYRTGNDLMAEASEWRAVSGVTPELYARLRPRLCALPIAELSPINVNTLRGGDAVLLAMLFPGTMTVGGARRILAERPANGWGSSADFWNTPGLRDITPPGDALRQPQIRSQWFAVDMQVNGDDGLRETALFDARRPPVRLVSRRWTGDE